MHRIPPSILIALCASSALGFVALARAVNRRQVRATDRSAREHVQDHRSSSGDTAAHAASPLGSEVVHGPFALGVSIFLGWNNAGAAAVLPVVASAVTVVASELFEKGTDWQPPPPGHPKQHEASFPSGHAMETSAVGLTSAYLLVREDLAHPAPALALVAAISVATTASRIYLDRHWISDAVGGWLLGIATAAALGAVYETIPAAGGAPRRRSLRSL